MKSLQFPRQLKIFNLARPEFAFSTIFQLEYSKFKYSDFSSSRENVARPVWPVD